VSGVVIQLGSNVTKFKVGQRVIGHCDSLVTRRTTNGGFQRYSTVRQRLVSPLPDSIPLANAVVLPLGVDTAVAGLFQQLKLPLPSLSPKSIDKTILIWGGSSSCGSCAIQLAVAAGLRVITTASRSNFAYVKSLGASEVFDYSEGDTLGRIKTVLKPGDLVFDCISTPEAQIASAEILSSIGGGLLPIVLWPTEGLPANVKAQVGARQLPIYLLWNKANVLHSHGSGIGLHHRGANGRMGHWCCRTWRADLA
jgi:NADPH:quinone reductase-like Zn-dependent oxidoreductase